MSAASVWVDDRLVAREDARISVFDHGFTVADGVFETLKVVRGRPFAVGRHLRRLHTSAARLGLADPDLDRIRHAIDRTVEANAGIMGELGRLRVTYTAGAGPLGSDRDNAPPTLVVAVSAMAPWPASAAVITVPWPRNDRGALVGVKSTSYAENVVALAEARRHGAAEAVMPDTRGRLCEGTGSNVLVVIDGRVCTPTLATGALPGITRELVLEWCDVDEVDIPLEVWAQADAAALTSSTRDVQVIHRIDERDLPEPPPVLRGVRERFMQASAEAIDP